MHENWKIIQENLAFVFLLFDKRKGRISYLKHPLGLIWFSFPLWYKSRVMGWMPGL